MIWYIVSYLIVGILSALYVAYNPFTKRIEWSMGESWIFFVWQIPLMWIITVLLFPYYLVKTKQERIENRKALEDWRRYGCFTMKIK